MQLIECYIENFGKFSKYRHTFTAGFNEIADENGWGKSTLAAFIKVMFYGFDDERKRSGEKERKKYEPWQGGEYGGRLTFKTDEGTFTVCRSFGKTEKSDDFKLLDALTGAESARFDKEIGRELFQIDRDTFFNTLYVSQTDRRAQVTDDIHARIGSQDHILEDISGYQEIEKRIKDELNHATPRRKGGFLYELQKQISGMRQEQEKQEELEKTVEKRRGQLQEAKNQWCMLLEQRKRLQEQRSQRSIYEGLAAKKKRYEELLKEDEKRQAAAEQARGAFPGRLPQKEECDDLQALAEKLLEVSQKEEVYRLTDGEQQRFEQLTKKFDGQAPSEDTLLAYEKQYKALQELRMELAAQQLTAAEEEQLRNDQALFTEEVTGAQFEQQIENTRACARLQNALQEKRLTLHAFSIAQREKEQSAPKNAKLQSVVSLSAGVLCVLAGIGVLVASGNMVIGAAVLFAGICLCLWGLYAGKRTVDTAKGASVKDSETELLKREIDEEEQQLAALRREIHEFLAMLHSDCPDQETDARLYELKADYGAYQNLLAKKNQPETQKTAERADQLYKELHAFLVRYAPAQAENERLFDGALRVLEQDAQLFRQLFAKKQDWERTAGLRNRLKAELTERFHALSMVPGAYIQGQLRELNEHIQQYNQCVLEAAQSGERVRAFAAQENIEELLAVKPPQNMQTVEELDEQIRILEEKSAGLQNSIDQYVRALEQSNEELDQLALAAEELKELEERQQRVRAQYELLELTQTYLGEAKTNLTNRYTKPLLDSLKKYYEILSNGEECHYILDANIKVTLDIGSIPKELSALSMGYQDLSWLCMRMAFIEAMYQSEKPFIIMDDPFVNMDEKKIDGGKKLLRNLASEYQVIYFTCHQSRSMEAV